MKHEYMDVLKLVSLSKFRSASKWEGSQPPPAHRLRDLIDSGIIDGERRPDGYYIAPSSYWSLVYSDSRHGAKVARSPVARKARYPQRRWLRAEISGQDPRYIDCWKRAKSRAAQRDISCMTRDEFNQLWQRANGHCELTGLAFDLTPGTEETRRNPHVPSIDRINASGDYSLGNSRLVLSIVNLAINEFGVSVFDKMCRAYVNQQRISAPTD